MDVKRVRKVGKQRVQVKLRRPEVKLQAKSMKARKHQIDIRRAQMTEQEKPQPLALQRGLVPGDYITNNSALSAVVDPTFLEYAQGIYTRAKHTKTYFFDDDTGFFTNGFKNPNDRFNAGFKAEDMRGISSTFVDPYGVTKTDMFPVVLVLAAYLQAAYNQFLSGMQVTDYPLPEHISFLFNLMIKRRHLKDLDGKKLVPYVPTSDAALPVAFQAVYDTLQAVLANEKLIITKFLAMKQLNFTCTAVLVEQSGPVMMHDKDGKPYNNTIHAGEIVSSYYVHGAKTLESTFGYCEVYNVSGYENPRVTEYLAHLCSIEVSYYGASISDFVTASNYKEFQTRFKISPGLLRMVYAYTGTVYTSTETTMVHQDLARFVKYGTVDGTNSYLTSVKENVNLLTDKRGPIQHLAAGMSDNNLIDAVSFACARALPIGSCINPDIADCWQNMCLQNSPSIIWTFSLAAQWFNTCLNIGIQGYQSSFTLPRVLVEESYMVNDIMNMTNTQTEEEPIMIFNVFGANMGEINCHRLGGYAFTPDRYAAGDNASVVINNYYTNLKVVDALFQQSRSVLPIASLPETHDDLKAPTHMFIQVVDAVSGYTGVFSTITEEENLRNNTHFWLNKVPCKRAIAMPANTRLFLYQKMAEDEQAVVSAMASYSIRADQGSFAPSELDAHYDDLALKRKTLFGFLSRIFTKVASFAAGFIPVVGPAASMAVNAVGGLLTKKADEADEKHAITRASSAITSVQTTNGGVNVGFDLSALANRIRGHVDQKIVTA